MFWNYKYTRKFFLNFFSVIAQQISSKSSNLRVLYINAKKIWLVSN